MKRQVKSYQNRDDAFAQDLSRFFRLKNFLFK